MGVSRISRMNQYSVTVLVLVVGLSVGAFSAQFQDIFASRRDRLPRQGRESVLQRQDSESGFQRERRQSVLGCLKTCSKILLPVRAEKNGKEVILPNICAFQVERCRSNRNRDGALSLSTDQSRIIYPRN